MGSQNIHLHESMLILNSQYNSLSKSDVTVSCLSEIIFKEYLSVAEINNKYLFIKLQIDNNILEIQSRDEHTLIWKNLDNQNIYISLPILGFRLFLLTPIYELYHLSKLFNYETFCKSLYTIVSARDADILKEYWSCFNEVSL
jgi:hypothetical protein